LFKEDTATFSSLWNCDRELYNYYIFVEIFNIL